MRMRMRMCTCPAPSSRVTVGCRCVLPRVQYNGEEQQQGPGNMWLPPAADCAGDDATLYDTLEEHFWLPDRLAQKTSRSVKTAAEHVCVRWLHVQRAPSGRGVMCVAR